MDNTGLLIDYKNIIMPRKFLNLFSKIKIKNIQSFNKYHIGLILIIPKTQLLILETISKGNKRVEYLDNENFVNSILGYAWFIYDKKKNICEIMGVQGSLTKYILDSLLFGIPNNVNLWVGIPLENDDMMDLIENYISFGFKNPYICKTSPFGYTFPSYGLCMMKENNLTENISINEVLYVLENFLKDDNSCKVKLRFSKNLIKHLKILSNIGSTINKDNSISQKEIAGSFVVNKIDGSIFELEIDKNSIINGEEEGVKIVKSLYNFHTHPIEAYNRNMVNIGWPSGQDYFGYYLSMINNGTIVHFVIAVEGIYIISISNYWINRINNIKKDSIKKFIKDQYNFKRKKGRDINWYIRTVNSTSYKGFPLFLVQFLDWEDISSEFEVCFKKEDGNCLPNEDTIKKIENIYN